MNEAPGGVSGSAAEIQRPAAVGGPRSAPLTALADDSAATRQPTAILSQQAEMSAT